MATLAFKFAGIFFFSVIITRFNLPTRRHGHDIAISAPSHFHWGIDFEIALNRNGA